VILTNSALVDNRGDGSGGIGNSGAVVLTNSTIARNFSPPPVAAVSPMAQAGPPS